MADHFQSIVIQETKILMIRKHLTFAEIARKHKIDPYHLRTIFRRFWGTSRIPQPGTLSARIIEIIEMEIGALLRTEQSPQLAALLKQCSLGNNTNKHDGVQTKSISSI